MKKLLFAMLFLFVSLTSFAPTNLPDRIKKTSDNILLLNSVFTADSLNTFDYPVVSPILSYDSIRITSEYGMRNDPFDGLYRKHTGIDFVSNKEAVITATADGIVEKVVYSRYGYGNYVVIKHSNNIRTRYAHLKSISVEEGDSINRFNPLGIIGRTGRATGIHLHYEILEGLKPIDPMSYFTANTKDEYISTLQLMEQYVKSNNII